MEKKNYVPMDGNEAAAYAALRFTEIAAIPDHAVLPDGREDRRVVGPGKKNLFGQPVRLIEMQSEAELSSGARCAGGRVPRRDVHLFSGTAADDPGNVQDRWIQTAGRDPWRRGR